MIRKLTVENLKCFGGRHEAPLAKLNLIFGQNNSGKSSLLQSLLLLRQSLESPGDAAGLNLGGPIYAAGAYPDIVHDHEGAKRLLIGMSFDTPSGAPVRVEVQFAGDEPRPPRLSQFLVRQSAPQRSVKVSRGQGRGGPYQLRINSQLIGAQDESNFSFRAGSFLPIFGEEPARRGRPSHARAEARRWANEVISDMARLLKTMRALGPFRSPPLRRYEFSGGALSAVDFLGRQVVDALVQDHVGRRKRDASELVKGVNEWLQHLARVKLELSEVSKSQKLWEVRLRDTASGRFSNFADVGFGVGQALPVLVEGKRTPTDGVFLVQEPEIHLHPDAQLAMGDFLVDLARSGRQVIVETHSEHILLRVRRRLAEATKNGLTPEEVSVLHIGWDNKHKSSTVTPLTIDQLGQVQNWPRGFFEEANVERLTLLQTMAAKAGKAAT